MTIFQQSLFLPSVDTIDDFRAIYYEYYKPGNLLCAKFSFTLNIKNDVPENCIALVVDAIENGVDLYRTDCVLRLLIQRNIYEVTLRQASEFMINPGVWWQLIESNE
jgi:hypothetical protein